MKKFKLISTLLVMAMILSVAGVFAGCSTGGDKNKNDDTPPDDKNDTGNGDTTDQGDNGAGNEGGDKVEDTDDFLTVTEKTWRGEDSCIPSFSEKQKSFQKMMGASIMADIRDAAADLSKSSFTIPEGDYGFEMKASQNYTHMAVPAGFMLEGIKRPDDNPFTIYADGATFWIEPTGLPCANTSYAFLLANCSNIKVVGLTVDEYTPNDIEGTVTKIDRQNNRIAIKLTNSSMALNEEVISSTLRGKQCRIVPYKADGTFIAPLYKIDPTLPGAGTMVVKGLASTGEDGEYWITLNSDIVIRTIHNTEWNRTYGSAGIIEEGDVISLLYGNVLTALHDCKQITIEGMKNHCTKGMPSETGGYGAHVWKDCYFGPRPGSSKVMTAGEYMLCGTRVGSTLDNVTIMSSSDDQVNIHGYLADITSINGNLVSVKNVHSGALIAGDVAEFYDKEGNLVLKRTLAEDVTGNGFSGRTLKFTESVDQRYKSCNIRFPAQECDGWTIKNCNFFNNYQRILIQSGSGTFENNKVFNMGWNMSVNNIFNTASIYEGGLLGNITIRNNLFYNSSKSPSMATIKADQSYNFDGKMLGKSLLVEGNMFVGCAYVVDARNFESVTAKGNVIIEPNSLRLDPDDVAELFTKRENVLSFKLEGNELHCTKIRDGDSTAPTNKNFALGKKLLADINNYVENSDRSATEIIEIVKKHLA